MHIDFAQVILKKQLNFRIVWTTLNPPYPEVQLHYKYYTAEETTGVS